MIVLTRRKVLAVSVGLCLAHGAKADEKIPIVATFSILADIVRNVGGDRLSVATLVGPDSDAHVYEPTAADGRTLAQARLVFVNGLGFEGWIDRLVRASKTKAEIVVAASGVKPRKLEEGTDPHAWQDVANAKLYVAAIRDALIRADAAGGDYYRQRADDYLAQLDALDADIVAKIEAVPKERRRVVSTHDAFGYFAARYGVDFIAPEGVSTESEPSAKDVAHIIATLKKTGVGALFLENMASPRLMRRIAEETGAKIRGSLFSDALSRPNGAAASYIDMMRHNVKELTGALTH
jgi:zinc/manganese transport system substrate-binding protein